MKVLGIDVGGSAIKAAIVDGESGTLCSDFVRISTPVLLTPQTFLDIVSRLIAQLGWAGPVGCGFPAVIRHGVAETAANVDKSWIGCHIQELLEQAVGFPCAVVNDADAAGLAEMRFGGGRGEAGSVMVLTLGTGIGSALFYRKQLFPNLELGHLDLGTMSAEHYASAAVKTNEKLEWQEWAERLNLFFNHVERLFSPKLIILGGAVSADFEKFSPYLQTQAQCLPAQFLNHAGVIGAACYFTSRSE